MATLRAPTKKGKETDSFNDFMRVDPEYRDFLTQMGVDPDMPVKLSGQQRSSAEKFIRGRFPDLPGKFQVDGAGNINTDHGISTAWSNPYFRTALIAGGTLGVGMAVAPAAFGIGAGSGATTAAGSGAMLGSTGLPAIGAQSAASLLGAAPAVAGGVGAGTTAALTTAATEGVKKGMDWKGLLGKAFGKGGIDPTTLALGGLSILDGDDSGQERKSFEGTGADPTEVLPESLNAIRKMASAIQSKEPTKLRNSVVNSTPSPVSIEGLPFQIGGGLATDPALRDESLITSRNSFSPELMGELFKKVAGSSSSTGAKRRDPMSKDSAERINL